MSVTINGDTGVSKVQDGVIVQADLDERGDYIAAWNHPTLPRPTYEQLAGVE